MMRKYIVGDVQKRLVKVLISPKFLEKEPVRVFAIACRYKLEVETRLAARQSLGRDPFGEFSTDCALTTDLRWVPAV